MQTLMRWLAGLPLSTLQGLGALLGWLAYALSPRYRKRLKANVAAAGFGPEVRREAIREAGRMVAELPWLWLRPLDRPLGALLQWHGADAIDDAIAGGRGLVLLTPHLGCFEVCAQAIAERYGARVTLTAMYRPADQAWLREMQLTARHRPGLATAPASIAGVRQMIRALRQGQAVGLLPDQVPPEGMGVWAPFFGQSAYTMTLSTRLVQQTGAALLLIWAERLPHGRGFVLRVGPMEPALPLRLSPSPSPSPSLSLSPSQAQEAPDADALQLACATAVNQAMERLIAQRPGQYLWGYFRHKHPRPQPSVAAAAVAGAKGPR
ncbi:MAG: lysophospholipid acyltransferase family protein [Burkholderiaceae bacterium]